MMGYVRRGVGQITDAQSAVNCAAAGGTYDSTSGSCTSAAGGSLYVGQLASLGGGAPANNCANNPNPGTFWDVNCPFYCIVGGTGLFGGNDCWPCSNACPAGTNFDTTNQVCSSTPVTTKCVAGTPGVANPFTNIPMWVWAVALGIVALTVVKK